MTRRILTIAQFIEIKGISALARELDTNPSTVFNWKEYVACPRPRQAKKLINISANLLTWESIYSPYVDHKAKAKKKALTANKQLTLF